MTDSTNHISTLRAELLGTLRDLRNRDQPMEPDRARAIATVAGVLVDSARAEVEYIKATGADGSTFLEQPDTDAAATRAIQGQAAHNPFGRTVHRIKG